MDTNYNYNQFEKAFSTVMGASLWHGSLPKPEELEDIPCLLCGNTELSLFNKSIKEPVHDKNMICETCGLVFITPRLKEEQYLEYYKEKYVRDIYGVKAEQDVPEVLAWRGRRANDKIGYFPDYFLNYKKVLEIGAGTGVFLKILREQYGSDVFGIEPSTQFAHIARKYSEVPLYEGTVNQYFKDHGAARRFDMIIMDQVLEHLYDPLGTLRILYELLEPPGYAYIGVPNLADPAHPREEFFIGPHLTSFSPWTLAKILSRVNLKIVKLFAPPASPMHCIVTRIENPIAALPLSSIPGPFSTKELQAKIDAFKGRT